METIAKKKACVNGACSLCASVTLDKPEYNSCLNPTQRSEYVSKYGYKL